MFESSSKKSSYSTQDLKEYLDRLADVNVMEFRQES
jgi:hypothetical protein